MDATLADLIDVISGIDQDINFLGLSLVYLLDSNCFAY